MRHYTSQLYILYSLLTLPHARSLLIWAPRTNFRCNACMRIYLDSYGRSYIHDSRCNMRNELTFGLAGASMVSATSRPRCLRWVCSLAIAHGAPWVKLIKLLPQGRCLSYTNSEVRSTWLLRDRMRASEDPRAELETYGQAVYMHANSRVLALQEVCMQAKTNVGQRQCRRKVLDGNKLLRNVGQRQCRRKVY